MGHVPFYHPSPQPPGVFGDQVLPWKQASPWSRLNISFATAFFKIAHGRPIDENDPWQVQQDARCEKVTPRIMSAFQARLPPSRRTEGYRAAPLAVAKTDKAALVPDPALIFTPRASAGASREPSTMETLVDPREDDPPFPDQLDLALRLSQSQSRRASNSIRRPSLSDSLRNAPKHGRGVADGPPTDKHISEKLAAAGSKEMSRKELLKRYGKRKTAKILSGRLAVEDGHLYDMDLLKACYQSHAREIWTGALLYVFGFSIRTCIPLVTRQIIDAIVDIQARDSGDGSANPPSLGSIIGFTAGFLAMMVACNVLATHSMRIGNLTGVKTRSALVDMISRKSLRLTAKARQRFTDGKINSFITADAGYAETAIVELYLFVMCPPVIIIGIALVIWTIGVAGLAGIGVLATVAPLQNWAFRSLFKYRKHHLEVLDKRTSLLTETIRHLANIKLFGYEILFSNRIAALRLEETSWVRKLSSVNALATVVGVCIPAVAAVVTFTIHVAMGRRLDLGQVFATLQFFNFLQQPLMWFPRILNALANIVNAARRLEELFIAEEKPTDHDTELHARLAINVSADFEHEAPFVAAEQRGKERKRDKIKAKVAQMRTRKTNPAEEATEKDGRRSSRSSESHEDSEEEQEQAFCLANVKLKIARGSLVCVVGRVGSGKSTLLSVPQAAWVQSGSIRQNITFSSLHGDTDEDRLARVVYACGLQEDLDHLSDGVDTNVGERGITLSGGQKQRVCIARAAYAQTDIVLLDDPLSAVDAQVGHHLLQEAILKGPLADRTRILVTHHLDVLPRADLILMLDSNGKVGEIVQQGTYEDLIATPGPFRQLIEEYGSKSALGEEVNGNADARKDAEGNVAPAIAQKKGVALMLEEEREEGSVSLGTYKFWLANMGPRFTIALLLAGYVVSACSSVSLTLWLGFWQTNQFDNLTSGRYQGIYAALAVAAAFITFICNIGLINLVLRASIESCMLAVNHVMRSPTSFLDRTPTGRIVSRLCKDVVSADTDLAWSVNRIFNTLLALVGSFGLVAWTLPWYCFGYLPVILLPANRDVKRLESLQRSHLYANFAEQLNGSAVIRAFQKVQYFELQMQAAVDNQNRFTFLRRYMHIWLSMRAVNAIFLLPFGIALYGIIDRESINPAKFAVTLTFIMQTAYLMLDIIPMLSMFEQEMNSVERIKYYSQLESEAPLTEATDPAPGRWPTQGAMTFTDVQLRYRPELPLVLKGLSFDVKAGEKIGVIGRTGAGKSSLVQSIYRTVELASGSIQVDGVDLKSLGLHTGAELTKQLRSRLAIIPQEAFLFAGTIRANMDPEGIRSDVELNDALSLIHSSPSASESIRDKFKLDADVSTDGSNFSAGEKQLLSLLRALVRGCKVLVLDEATSSVDPETDALIQRIIQTEFSRVTLISIAHRLQTVAYYDRILVMDAGTVAEYDTPLRLFDTPSSNFRSLCDVKKISRGDLLQIQADAASASRHP